MTALRFMAMGRPNHPDVQALAEFLAMPERVVLDVPKPDLEVDDPFKPATAVGALIQAEENPRRGRKPKAD